jgi:hypothetical protein
VLARELSGFRRADYSTHNVQDGGRRHEYPRIETGDLVKTRIPVIQALEESTIQVERASHPEED